MAQRPYRQVTLIGKSLGTLSLGYLLTTQTLPLHARSIWLTPLIQSEKLRQQIQRGRHPSLFVIGTADPYYNVTYLAEIQAATGSEIMTIEGADHSLNIENNVLQSIQALEQVMRAIETFLADMGKAEK